MKFNENELNILNDLVTRGPTEYLTIANTEVICSETLDNMIAKGILLTETLDDGKTYKINPSICIPVCHAITLFNRIEEKLIK